MKKIKKCKGCEEIKNAAEFYFANKSKGILHARCILCFKKRHKELYKYNPKKIERQKEWQKNNPINRKKHYLKYAYGMTLDDYEKLKTKQNDACVICLKPETRKKNNGTQDLVVDHCHETGKVRGLLCSKCNTAIGQFAEDPNIFHSALRYLELHNA